MRLYVTRFRATKMMQLGIYQPSSKQKSKLVQPWNSWPTKPDDLPLQTAMVIPCFCNQDHRMNHQTCVTYCCTIWLCDCMTYYLLYIYIHIRPAHICTGIIMYKYLHNPSHISVDISFLLVFFWPPAHRSHWGTSGTYQRPSCHCHPSFHLTWHRSHRIRRGSFPQRGGLEVEQLKVTFGPKEMGFGPEQHL